jgi:glycosyltransferase involved in cell wall biosynthesis
MILPDESRNGAAAADRPRLLYVSTLDHIVGVMLPHLDAARECGFAVEVACRVTRLRDELLAHADAVHDLPFRRFPLHPANLAALVRLVRLLRARPCRIVHAHNPTGGFVGRLAATIARVPVRVYTAHGFHFHPCGRRLANAAYRAVERIAGHLLSDGVLVINRVDYDAALRQRVVPKDKLFLTGGVGISTETFDPAAVPEGARRGIRREVGAADEAVPVLTVVGELIPRKRHADALDAFALLRRTHPSAVLLLVGDGALLDDLRARAERLGIAGGCRFLGFRRDVAAVLAATDVFLFPSLQEGLPCSVQEALCMEVPVVASDVRGNADLVDDGCGRLVPPGDPRALAEAAAELLALRPHERRRMGAAGRAKMIRDFGRGACVGQWLAVYDRLLARKGLPAISSARFSAAREGEASSGVELVPRRRQPR